MKKLADNFWAMGITSIVGLYLFAYCVYEISEGAWWKGPTLLIIIFGAAILPLTRAAWLLFEKNN